MMISDLPLDLESEILSRVTAKTLSHIRFTCKRWSTNTSKYRRLVDLVVWNPSTGQTRWIQRNRGHRYTDKYFLGYEKNKSSTGSYKIVGFNSDYANAKEAVARIEIYESNSDAWRVVDDVSDWYTWFNVSLGVCVSLKGNTYWFDYYYHYKEEYAVSSILMFDFTTERLGRLSLPFHTHNYGDETVVLSAVREEKLALLRFDRVSLEMKIWVTTNTKIDEAKDLSWGDFLVVDFGKLEIESMKGKVSFLVVDKEKKMVVCCDTAMGDYDDDDEEHTRIFIVGENMHKQVYKETTKRSQYDRPFLLSYVPSLVQIHQLEAKEKSD
ncbi:unnamed protein product [Microthlaspi erraticum]|uniref:F-box domain-containing protein n=1 Tax=Microthlaspi erraticum TaxID=1685480 RepID=A0A6D2JZP5_9BRAS|nr:unnamed protein product [Microthlaspi erraticum]